jgi:RimJ/RimL family protein N-acetyltransferase
MAHPLWPLYDLRLTTADPAVGALELRLPTEAELPAFVALARRGIHPPDEMPFSIPWTDLPSPARERSSYQFYMSTRAGWTVDDWVLTCGAWVDGEPAGFQDLRAHEFPVYRTVGTGSWLGQSFQGRGIGKLMRQAVLALAFDHLGARVAETDAFLDNTASHGVSLGVGYEPNGIGQLPRRGVARDAQRFRMTLDGWRARTRPAVTVEGLEGCLDMFGLEASPPGSAPA